MIHIRRSEERGHADHGWLDTYHTFSFAGFRDPEFDRFSLLRVLNQDRVAPGQGFGTHGHQDMEIVSYVIEGRMEHKDSMGNGSVMRPGEVQLMSAGSGVTHSEFNGSTAEPLHFLQMWVHPAQKATPPRYAQKHFAEDVRRGKLCLVASPDGEDDALVIGQDVRLYLGLLDGDEAIQHSMPANRAGWLHVARGSLALNGQQLGPGDGAAIRDEPALGITEGDGADFLLWDLPNVT